MQYLVAMIDFPFQDFPPNDYLGMLVSYLENGKDKNPLIPEVIGLRQIDKRKRFRKAIKANELLYRKWEILESRLVKQNMFRRFLSYGIVMNHIAYPGLEGLNKSKLRNGVRGFHFQEIPNSDIKEILTELIGINSGSECIGVLTGEIKGLL